MKIERKKIIIVIILILMLGLVSGIIIINNLLDHNIKLDDPPSKEGLVFTKDVSYDYNINNVNHKITFKFSVKNNGTLSGFDEYIISVQTLLDGKNISPSIKVDSVQTEEEYKNNDVYSSINLNNLKTISDGNKYYIVILIKELLPAGDPSPNPIIVNDDGIILKTVKLTGGQSLKIVNSSRSHFYQKTDDFGESYYDKYVIKDNAIYYLAMDCKVGVIYDDKEKNTIVNEYKVTVENGSVVEKQVGRYDALGAGATC